MDKEMTKFRLDETMFWKGLLVFVRIAMIVCSVVTTTVIIIGCIMRVIFHTDFYGIDDIILLFAFWLYFMGAVHGSYENSHIKADIVPALMKNLRLKDIIGLIAQVILIIVSIILLVWAWNYFLAGVIEMPRTTALKIPYAIPRFAIFLGMLIMSFYHIFYFYRNVKKFRQQGYYSDPNEFDFLPDNIQKRYPNSGIMTKDKAISLHKQSKMEIKAERKGKQS